MIRLVSQEDFLKYTKSNPFQKLGEINNAFQSWLQSTQELQYLTATKHSQMQANGIQNQALSHQSQNEILDKEYQIANEALALEYTNLQRQKSLYQKGIISKLDWEKAQLNYSQAKSQVESRKISLKSHGLQNMQIKQQSISMSQKYEEEVQQKQNQIANFKTQLIATLDMWKEKYLIQAPIDGALEYQQYWSTHQNITQNDVMFKIIATSGSNNICKIYIPVLDQARLRKINK
jgi:hypothetical protein